MFCGISPNASEGALARARALGGRARANATHAERRNLTTAAAGLRHAFQRMRISRQCSSADTTPMRHRHVSGIKGELCWSLAPRAENSIPRKGARAPREPYPGKLAGLSSTWPV
eukprot:4116899-Alexandrium_andersonii.AAC.1